MRGQVVVREDVKAHYSTSIIVPDTVMANERSRKTHRGVVIAVGRPARVHANRPSAEVPHGFAPGDEVVYHYTHNEKAHTRKWPPDGEDATWVPQGNIDAVIEKGRAEG